eukprot:763272-Hanusia_phi.AAC.1
MMTVVCFQLGALREELRRAVSELDRLKAEKQELEVTRPRATRAAFRSLKMPGRGEKRKLYLLLHSIAQSPRSQARDLVNYFRIKFLEVKTEATDEKLEAPGPTSTQGTCPCVRRKPFQQDIQTLQHLLPRSSHPIESRMSEIESWR